MQEYFDKPPFQHQTQALHIVGQKHFNAIFLQHEMLTYKTL
jgi:hypothetical protein